MSLTQNPYYKKPLPDGIAGRQGSRVPSSPQPSTGPYNPGSPIDPMAVPTGDWRNPTVNVQVGATPGSAIDRYYDRLINLMPSRRGQGFADLSALGSSFASDERMNRGLKGDFQQGYDRMMLGRDQAMNEAGQQSQSDYDRLMLAALADRRESESDAMRKIQQGEYLKGGGANFQPTSYSINGQSFTTPRFSGIEPQAATAAEREAGGLLSSQMMDRLKSPGFVPTKFEPKWNYQPMDPSQYTKPGVAEQIGRWGSVAAGGLSVLDMLRGGAGDVAGAGSSISKMLGGIPGMSKIGGIARKVAGPAGIVTGGLGLATQGGLRNNLMNGATTGAGIGTMVMPGIGTAVGAGLGAAAGGIKSLFSKLFGGGKPKPQTQVR